MNTISVSYDLKYRFKNHPHIQLKDKRNIFNVKTGRRIKLTTNGGSIGIWIGRDFIVKSELNNYVELIPKREYCPF